ncbi:MAG: hypothetical protein K8W52_13705 [Deltaproteobacteria bacterium]|nr:hypothetical protein [Deltaproteobacteria bacterium]
MSSPLPPLYAAWIDALLGGTLPSEVRATCDACAMAPRADDPPGERRFDPGLKCCTFYPDLPNFSVGAILADPSASGRREIDRRFGLGAGITPLGMTRPTVYQLVFAQGGNAFGRSNALRCGFLDAGGRCGIWAHRESTCVSYYCKFERGAIGRNLWRALQDLLGSIERQLAQWCVLELDPGGAAIASLFRAPSAPAFGHRALDGVGDPAELRLVWGTWAGREREFFARAHALVRGLTWARVLEVCGPEVAGRAKVLVAAYQRHGDPTVPDSLRLGPHQVTPLDAHRVWLRGYSTIDPVEVAPAEAAALTAFDGRPTEVVVAELAARGVPISSTQITRLAEFEVLIPASTLVRR